MKKIAAAVLTGILACTVLSAQSMKLENTFGGDSDTTGGDDFVTFSKVDEDKTKEKDGHFENSGAFVSDRLQLDYSSEKIDGRLRMELKTSKSNGKDASVRFRGFMRFRPISAFGLAAGNEFFTKIAVDAGYLAAADDTPKYARMAKSGFAVIGDFAGLKLVGNIDGGFDVTDADKVELNFGINYGLKDIVTFGAAAQNVTGDNFCMGVFAGLNAVENLIFNAGFIYNAEDSDFIPFAAKTALSATIGYDIKDIGLGFYADVVAGLTNEYINGENTAEYKNSDGDDGIPMGVRARAAFAAAENFSFNLDAKVSAMIGWSDTVQTVVYPYVEYELPSKFGTLTAGMRFTFEGEKYSGTDGGLRSFSIPLAWKCRLADKK